MTPRIIKIIDRIVTCVVILAVVLLVSHIVVCGREIDGISEMTDTNCTVTITTYQHMEQNNAVEYELGPEEILKLKTLILSSNFSRGLARTMVSTQDRDRYEISINFNEEKRVVIQSLGNEYISIFDDDIEGFLRIHNKNWEAALNDLVDRANKISLDGTVFTYNGISYNFAELENLELANLVYNLYEYEQVGDRILLIGSMGKNAEYYAVFNPETQAFERGITAAHFIYQEDDIQSTVYSFEKSIYKYDGTLIKTLSLSETEYIDDISYDETGNQLYVDITNNTSDNLPRQEIVLLNQ